MPDSKEFLSCDWGSSFFRLRLVETASLRIIAESISARGMVAAFELWGQNTDQQKSRIAFYMDFINDHIRLLEQKANRSLEEVPLLISGMASSSIGMKELDYKMLPFSVDGSDLRVETITEGGVSGRKVVLISGARTHDDVMRGEETILVGSAGGTTRHKEATVFIFPGTHSKHVWVVDNQAVSFHTFMTGEFFDLLSNKSILSHSVENGGDLRQPDNRQSFEKGVRYSLQANLMNSCFTVRTNILFDTCSPGENYYYLSGLLIGTELSGFYNKQVDITVVGNLTLLPCYEAALEILNKPGQGIVYRTLDVSEALVRGQFKILSLLNL